MNSIEERGLAALATQMAEIARLQEEVATWKDRYEAERQAHEATIAHCDNAIGALMAMIDAVLAPSDAKGKGG